MNYFLDMSDFIQFLKNLKYKKLPFKYFWYGLDKLLFNNRHINGALLSETFSEAHQELHSRTSEDNLSAIFPSLKNVSAKTMKCYDYEDEKDEVQMLHKMRKAEFYGMMQKTLSKVDKMSMANSLEVRVPFLKKSFIEQALKIHPSLSFGKKQKKKILKDLLRSILPKSPIGNVKRGFMIPLGKWLKEELKIPVYEHIFDNEFTTSFHISDFKLKEIWDEHQNGSKDHKWFIFTLYSLAVWHKSLKK